MKYLSSRAFAEKWGLNIRTVRRYCEQEKIAGAVRSGSQWLIPAGAQKPEDGRTKRARSSTSGQSQRYRFPALIFTPYYADRTDLNDDELRLLKAQLLHFEGKFCECIVACRKILSGPTSWHVRVGAHCTIGFAALLFGLTEEYRNAINMLEGLVKGDRPYVEDAKVLIASLKHLGSWNTNPIKAIDSAKLSPDATTYYKYLCLVLLLFGHEGGKGVQAAYQYAYSDCKKLEDEGVEPALVLIHSALGCLADPSITPSKRKYHLSIAVEIAVKNNWITMLSKFYNFYPALMEECLRKHDENLVTILQKQNNTTMRRWGFIHNLESGLKDVNRHPKDQLETMILINYGYSTAQIASVIGYSEQEVEAKVQEICETASVGSLDELVSYVKAFFDPAHKIN